MLAFTPQTCLWQLLTPPPPHLPPLLKPTQPPPAAHLLPGASVWLILLSCEAHTVHKSLTGLRAGYGQPLQQEAACLQDVLVNDGPGLQVVRTKLKQECLPACLTY
jgi:hypothetical protein